MAAAIEAGSAAFIVTGVAFNLLLASNGAEGEKAREQAELASAAVSQRIAMLAAEHAALEQRAARMSRDGLDTDFLEERVRSVLGLVHPEEYLVRMKDVDRIVTRPQAALAEPVVSDSPA